MMRRPPIFALLVAFAAGGVLADDRPSVPAGEPSSVAVADATKRRGEAHH